MGNPSRLKSSSGPSLTTGGNGLSVSPFVDESGKSIGLQCFDTSGNPTNIVNLSLSAGVQPTIYQNGTAISGSQWTYGIVNPAPEATAWLLQSSPASKTYGFGDGNFSTGGYSWSFIPSVASYSGNPQSTTTTGELLTFVVDGFLPGTYQLAITWPTDATLATSVPVTVQTITNGALDTSTTALNLNQSVAPNDFTFGGYGWKILDAPTIDWPTTGFQFTITNPGGKIAFDALQVARTSPDLSVTIAPTDVVTMDLPYGWATTAAGPIIGPAGTAPAFADADFSNPATPADFGTYNPTGTPWTFSGAGPSTNSINYSANPTTITSSNGSGVGATTNSIGFPYTSFGGVPDGTHVAFLQGTSSMSQAVTFAAGEYSIAFEMTPRKFDPAGVVITILVDGTSVGTFTTPSIGQPSFSSYRTLPFAVTAGSHTIEFSQVNPSPATSPSTYSTTFFYNPTIQASNGLTGIPVTNNVGVPSVGLPNTNQQTTMILGYNVGPDNAYYNPAFLYSNVMRRVSFAEVGAVLGPLNYPTLYTQTSRTEIVAEANNGYPKSTRFGMNSVPNGKWTLLWNGLSVGDFSGNGDHVFVEDTSYQILNQATGNRRVVNIQSDPNQTYSPLVSVQFSATSMTPNGNGQYPYDFSALEIYPPDPSDPTGMTPWLTGQPTLYPTTATWLKGARIIRNLDVMSANNCNSGIYADLRPPLCLGGPVRVLTSTIATISNVTGTPFFDQSAYVSFQVAFTSPHSFFETALVSLTTTNQLTFANGATNAAGSTLTGFVHVIDGSTIEFQDVFHQVSSATSLTASSTGGSVTISTGTGGSWLESIDLCTANNSHLHATIPLGMDDAGVTQMGTDCANRLGAGLQVYLESVNEHWNTGFYQYHWFSSKSVSIDGTTGPAAAYVQRAAHVHSLFIAAWVAAGRNASDVIRVMGGQGTYTVPTSNVVAACAAQGVTFDHFVVANYIGNGGVNGGETAFNRVLDGMTTDQVLDYFGYNLRNGNLANIGLDHRAILDAAGLTHVTIGFYEGGISAILPSVVNAFERTYEALNHPRIFGQQFYFQQLMQDVAHAKTWAIYYLFGPGYVNNPFNRYQANPSTWTTYYGYNQANGTGDPTLDAANLNTPLAFNVTKSEAGGAVALFNLLRSGPVVSSTSSVNAQQRAIGRKPNRHHGI